MIQRITNADEATAVRTLDEADGSLKTAVVALLVHCSVSEAKRRLDLAGGRVRGAIAAS
jgi:N-acetylmuramic acid 6-phosphate etherase